MSTRVTHVQDADAYKHCVWQVAYKVFRKADAQITQQGSRKDFTESSVSFSSSEEEEEEEEEEEGANLKPLLPLGSK